VAETLAALGPKARAAIPTLVAVILEPKRQQLRQKNGCEWFPAPVREKAAEALVAIGPDATPAIEKTIVPAIIESIKLANPKGTVFDGAWGRPPVWITFRERASALAPVVAESIRQYPEEKVYLGAYLPKLGPAGHKEFVGLLTDKDTDIRRAVVVSLRMVVARRPLEMHDGEDFTPYASYLIPYLKDDDYSMRVTVLQLLILDKVKPTPEIVAAVLGLFEDIPFMEAASDDYHIGVRRGWEVTNYMIASGHGKLLVPTLIRFLDSKDRELRGLAFHGLGMMGRAGLAALPRFRELARGSDPDEVIDAAYTATRISLDAKDAEPIVRLLTHNVRSIKSKALRTFHSLDRVVAPYLRNLLPLLKDKSEGVRFDAVQAINDIASNDPEAGVALAQWFVIAESKHTGQWRLQSGAGFAEAIPTIVASLGDVSGPGVSDACYMIARIGPEARLAVPALIRLLDGSSESPPALDGGPSREAVLQALGAIGPEACEAVPVLRKLLAKSDTVQKRALFLCLADIGKGAKDAIPDLKQYLTEPDPELRLLASCALTCIENDIGPYYPLFARVLRGSPDEFDSDVFGRVCVRCPELRAAVSGLLRSPRYLSHHNSIVRMIGCLAPDAKHAIPELVNALNEQRWWMSDELLCETLGAFGPAAKDALPRLRELLDSSDYSIAAAAKEAIGRIEAKK
jgi:HEAT repeat protein